MADWVRRGNGRKLWSSKEIIEAIKLHYERFGTAPRHEDWDLASPTHPTSRTVTRQFGSWNQALEATGVPTRRRVWTRDEVIAAMREDAAIRGTAPSDNDWKYKSATHPGSKTVRAMFGSFGRAVAAAGLEPKPARVHERWYTERELIDAILEMVDQIGRIPRVVDWTTLEGSRPGYDAILRTFGSWRNALLAAGLDEEKMPSAGPGQGWTRPRMLAALVKQETLSDVSPAKKKWRRGSSGKHPNEASVRATFGSWSSALKAAGIAQEGPGAATTGRFALTESVDRSRSPFES